MDQRDEKTLKKIQRLAFDTLASVRAGKNPAMGIRNFREAPPRARVLSDAEFARVVEAFEAIPDPHVRAAFVLLLDTGARKSEALCARWEDFDLEAGIWRIPSPKAGRPQVVPRTVERRWQGGDCYLYVRPQRQFRHW